jgi:hypothetical protein
MRRRLFRIAVVTVIAVMSFYGLSCYFLYENQRGLIYFPGGTRVAAADTNFVLSNHGVVLRGWQLNPGHARALLYFGGNAEALGGERDDLAALFPDRTVYLVAYRGYGASGGTPGEQALLSDSLALFDAVHAKHASVAVVGRSLGSGVACYLVSKRPVERLALVTPYDSLEQVAQAHYRLFPIDLLATERYESARYIQTYTGPILVMRAGRDEIVPPASTDRLLAVLRVKPVVKFYPLASHNSIASEDDYGPTLAGFMK